MAERFCPTCQWKFDTSRLSKSWVKAHHEADLCYCCSLWQPWIRRRNELGVVRFRGVHYCVLGDFEYNRHVESLLIEFRDGRIVTSDNVTCQGAIPTRFQGVLSSNARQVTPWISQGCGNLVFDDFEPVIEAPKQEPKRQISLF